MNYNQQIQAISNPSFEAIRNVSKEDIMQRSKQERDKLWYELKRGTALLNTHAQMCQYMFSFGKMHQAKLLDSFSKLDYSIFQNQVEVVDWGCGQAMGTINLFDYLSKQGLSQNIKRVTLIEPSKHALERAEIHVKSYCSDDVEVVCFSEFFEELVTEDISSSSGRNVIHIFSNILDVEQIDLKSLSKLIDSTITSDSYLVCVGPLNPTNKRIDRFFEYFDNNLVDEIYSFQTSSYEYSPLSKPCTYKSKIYKLERNSEGHLIPIEYYPPVHFNSAYIIDSIAECSDFSSITEGFEVYAPFDLGASVYDDVHPILAVMNNIVCRGIPTRASVYIEDVFNQSFGISSKSIKYGEISYPSKDQPFVIPEDVVKKYINTNVAIRDEDKLPLQLLLTPISVARFHKVLIEAIITNKVFLEEDQWNILVEEKDVPFSKIAVEDFKMLFNNLCVLSKNYDSIKLPNINLVTISNTDFKNSPLHLSEEVFVSSNEALTKIEYDFVFTHSCLDTISKEVEQFSKYRAKNNSYFNVKTANEKRTNRTIYTSDLVEYKNIVEKDSTDQYVELKQNKTVLTYFLQLFFRKESFRPGQLPILDRALRNNPVIGLLPTGGGKSLTYQIAALLQPGVTMIIDPLKSLMKDQYDGLISNGIDCASYINSTLTSNEKKSRETQLESSELLFVFLSPERLSIASFRERLRKMHEYNVYFAYGVIDEVHCVSEWGHDFRFSYLHLGRNLYNYVKAKSKEISLFGLTATASFDVLADVERELSGNGAFELDADVIVRYENTNRLELQYKIERVPVEFEVDGYYDINNQMASHLPKALNIKNKWPLFNSKSDFLQEYLKTIPKYLKELQKSESLDLIKNEFAERQNSKEGTDLNLELSISDDPFNKKEKYDEAGIVFCPHVAKTGLSVATNASKLRDNLVKDVSSFSGKDNDDDAMVNLEAFRDNKSPLMVATKAFGMGIDKPNVRFTVNMNYSSSLEAFVQEAGRSGRDRKMALASILVSDYKLVQISRKYQPYEFPLSVIKNKWFRENDLNEILEFYNLSIPSEYILVATPDKDIVKLHCTKDNRMFAFNECNETCTEFRKCQLKKVNPETKIWMSEKELIEELKSQNIPVNRKHFTYLNADYQSVMFFFNESFKGDLIEKSYMNNLLNINTMFIGVGKKRASLEERKGFLSTVLESEIDDEIVVFIPYSSDDYIDLSKAIYRMTCIELIEDFTQDYSKQQFRIITRRKNTGEYFQGLKRFLLRYYTLDRAQKELVKVKQIEVRATNDSEIASEIYQCLAYLTEFVYDKISEKRKRAIDDMRSFCMEGLYHSNSWLEGNEKLKDFIYYYFNSKYAKDDYVTESDVPFSLVRDTDGGKESSSSILNKYLRVIDDDVVGTGTPLDNVKHLYGAVRLIGRSLTDSNPALYLLEAFCLAYMGTKNNKSLIDQLVIKYSEGMMEFSNRIHSKKEFWLLFNEFNEVIKSYLTDNEFNTLKEETRLLVHSRTLSQIKEKYLN